MKTDTIAAIATAVSNGGISIIRISGDEAFSIIDKIYKSKKGKKLSDCSSHTVHYGYIADGDTVIDEVMVLLMRSPHTYTKEDVVEIDCHGGIVVTKKILETVLKYGARLADPGEFTKRAFLNGRIDLSQAEAVSDIINAKSEYALKNSLNQLRGNVLDKIKDIRQSIIDDIAFIEAALDDPEHITLDDFSNELAKHIEVNVIELDKLLKSSDNGRLLKEGIKTVILGKPNAGKSSLLNVLVGTDRAIVTDIAGTTRDTLEETIQIGGICLNVIDTAGIRNTEDIVEKIGVEKAMKSAEDADLIIYVMDASTNLDGNDHLIIDFIKNRKAIILLNKTDLNMVIDPKEMETLTGKDIIQISAKENMGIDKLEKWITDMYFQGKIDLNNEIYITNIRHKEAIMESKNSLLMVNQSIEDGMPEDFFSIDMMNAYKVLGEILGEAVDEDLVNTIFCKFCMGK
ncbi:tRNA uridine-5-carboxymethylaminomethyl(34) synthesis GTPase MnmE [Anaerocolumna aminovalerica]|mgnify:CR=1 FL=1|jgi:tRNA modification GTPase|uniref:tRNA modification GTPase MnmE n=1 Tax=Anaerocolumna aminovalerica TaxID=1527 RepID=A0A1I5HSY5_9FIRM|nr:tRNA uridine-5-carboxymethylaminomethyl(34) synthesis GTPase MnmE [Anaerocolumna aminovalerica]MBU5333028.1 tRNA uridine-5-carboxymethylaminomethyl(34) synthesis GTPase MnmE [Anaerocolumna aminovalerica]MDU6266313.1 tRNA uridine-5-carboxymethylaminomethyl(34) synthesis GTPase MnmE [Anaerocolumna aminovalerica]SFO51434.1 tRNA modification GTPase [Anaerocolumna aminovalerica]